MTPPINSVSDEQAAEQAADACGVTSYSDMRPFVVQAVKYALAARRAANTPVGDGVEDLRNRCAASGFHDHDGCSCSDDELRAQYASPALPSQVVGKLPALAMQLCAKVEGAYGWMDMSSNDAKENWASYCAAKDKLLRAATSCITSPAAEPVATAEVEVTWRDLALQFDEHRIQALEVIRSILRGDTDNVQAKAFLARPPVSGRTIYDRIIAERRRTEPVSDDMARRLVDEYRKIYPGAGWPPLEVAKQLLSAALSTKGGGNG